MERTPGRIDEKAAKKRRSICIVSSTRADWGLLSPIAKALRKHDYIDLSIIATNMHLDPSRGMTVNEIENDGFRVDVRVEMTPASDSRIDATRAMSRCLAGVGEALNSIKPDLLLILGDRYEMLAVASAATLLGIPIAHIAGGETTEGAIDDNIRHSISKLSSLHFASTESHRQRLINMGETPDHVFNVGSTGVWNMRHTSLLTREELESSLGFSLKHPLLLVTFHPATNDPVAATHRFAQLLNALDEHEGCRVVFTYPNNDPSSAGIITMIESYATEHPERVEVVPSLGYVRYLSMLRQVDAVVGNSSSGIIEVPSARIPTVDIGCRQRGRTSAASVIHCGDSCREISEAISKALSPEFRAMTAEVDNPYENPSTVDLITQQLTECDIATLLPKKFHDI